MLVEIARHGLPYATYKSTDDNLGGWPLAGIAARSFDSRLRRFRSLLDTTNRANLGLDGLSASSLRITLRFLLAVDNGIERLI